MYKLNSIIYLLFFSIQTKQNFFYKQKGECDFVVFNKGIAEKAIQVCYTVDTMNFERKYNGLVEALNFFNLNEGTIITLDQKDEFVKDGLTVKMIPACEFVVFANR